MAKWNRVMEIAGSLMQREPDLVPPRWRVSQFPSREQLDAMEIGDP